MLPLTEWLGKGYDGWWYAHMVDSAVTWAGRHIEGLLNERGKDGKAKYSLADVLEEPTEEGAWNQLFRLFGDRTR